MKRLVVLVVAAVAMVVLALVFKYGLPHDDESIGLPNVDWKGWHDDDHGEGWPW